MLYAGGVACEHLIYYLATGSHAEMHFINSKGEIQSIEELSLIPKEFLDRIKKNDYFLDFVTGDVFEFNLNSRLWSPTLNIGWHKLLTAENYMNRGKFVLMNNFEGKEITSKCNVIVSNCKEIKVTCKKQYLNHWWINNLPVEFGAFTSLTWFVHYYNVSFKKFQCKILCDSNRGPIVIEHDNTIGVMFHPSQSYKETIQLFENCIRRKFNDIQEKWYHIVNKTKLNKDEELPMMFRAFKMNDEIRSGKNWKAEDNCSGLRPFSSIAKVNSSRPFSKVKKVNKEANYCGFGFNNRDMVFVENNSINPRPISCAINPNRKLKFGTNRTFVYQLGDDIDRLKVKNNVDLNQKYEIKPNENTRISKLFKIGSREETKELYNNSLGNITSNIHLQETSSLKPAVHQEDDRIEDYISFIDKDKMDEDQMINYFLKVRKDICKNLTEISLASDFRLSKLERVVPKPDKKFLKINKKLDNSLGQKSKYKLKLDNDWQKAPNMTMLSHFPTEQITGANDNNNKNSVFKYWFPYTNESDFQQKPQMNIVNNDIDQRYLTQGSNPKITINMQQKSKSNYNKKFKQYEKELNSIGNVPTMSWGNEYCTTEERERREFLESKNNWVNNSDFKRVFGVHSTSSKPIPNVMSVGNSVSQHKFRDVNTKKWITPNGFIA